MSQSNDFTKSANVRDLYRKRAKWYDVSANLYYLMGFREYHFRKKAIDKLDLKTGDTVIEIGCGTGLNFALLEEKVGDHGKIIGVDITDAMLEKAKERIERNGWKNVELIKARAADYKFPDKVDGILSTFALTLEPKYAEVIKRGAGALGKGGRWVLCDLRVPDNWLRLLAPLFIFLTSPFGVARPLLKRHPWETMRKTLINYGYENLYLGYVYLAWGEAPAAHSTS